MKLLSIQESHVELSHLRNSAKPGNKRHLPDGCSPGGRRCERIHQGGDNDVPALGLRRLRQEGGDQARARVPDQERVVPQGNGAREGGGECGGSGEGSGHGDGQGAGHETPPDAGDEHREEIDKAAKAAEKLEQLRKDPPCFGFSTPVQTPNGLVEIQNLSVGDLVLARCEKTGDIAPRRVTQFFERRYVKIIHVISETDLGGRDLDSRDRIATTPEHPFWVQGRGWVEAGSLKAGDVLVGCGDYRVAVHNVIHGEKETFVFNIEVECFHTYYAGHHAVWGHNSCKGDVITDSGGRNGLPRRCSANDDGGQACCA